MDDEASELDQSEDDWNAADRPAQRRLQRRDRREDGVRDHEALRVRPAHRRLEHSSSNSAAALGAQRPTRRLRPCSTRPPSSTSASTIGTRQPENAAADNEDGAHVQRGDHVRSVHRRLDAAAAVTMMELMFNEASKLDQCIDDWHTAARPAQRRMRHSGRQDDGPHVQLVRPVHRRLRAQQFDQRSGAWSTATDETMEAMTLGHVRRDPPSSTGASTIGTQQPDQHSGDWNTAADTKMEIMSNEVPKPDTQLDGA